VIDFKNATFVKLSPVDPAAVQEAIGPVLLPDERILAAFKGVRDSVTFTDKRLIAVNVQGMTGKKRDWTSLPYARIQAFSLESAGVFDRDTELEVWLSGLGLVHLEFSRGTDVAAIARTLAQYVL
jgi:hypothetical protein